MSQKQDSTTILDIPNDIILSLFLNEEISFSSITNINIINKEFNNIITDNFESIITNKFKAHQDFINLIKNKKISVIHSDINLQKLLNILDSLEYVSKMKKGTRYQHLLINMYNGSLFNIMPNQDIDDQEYIESVTLGILMSLLDYVKNNFDTQKTNLVPWVLYCLLEYISLITSDVNRNKNTYFLRDDMINIIKDRIFLIKKELKRTKDCHSDIKYRLCKILNYLNEVYDEQK